jgi:Predicted carboxypeptidase
LRRSVIFLILVLAHCSAFAQVRFDADFESGSLGRVELLDSVRVVVAPGDTVLHLSYLVSGHFDPDNPVDTSLAPSANWYYFRMTGVKDKQIYLTMPDYGVPRTSCSYDGIHWEHLPMAESQAHSLDKRFTQDTVFLALYNPYTYSYLQDRLETWCARPDVTLDTIGFSHEGRPLQLLHITDPSVPEGEKARIWVHGRIHPSETPASYLVDGLVEYLTSDTPEGRSLRRQIDAYVLPFAHPDGVADGLSRSNARGVNQEINFGRSEDSTVVEVRAIKRMFEQLTADRPLDFMLNSHSQHSLSATFWMHRGSSTTPAYFRKLWTFTGLVSSMNPCIRPLDMNFSDMASRYAEGWFWNHAGENTIALTIETTYNCYSFDTEGPWADDENIRAFGKRTMQAVAEYLGLSLPGRYLVETPERMKSGWEPYRDDAQSYLGDGAWVATREGAGITYRMDDLPAGRYALYRYVAGDCVEPKVYELKDPETGEWIDPGVHGWVYQCVVEQPRDGRFRYTLKASAPGELFDALLLVRCE